MYYGEVSGYEVELDEKSSDFTWVSFEKVLELPLAASQKKNGKRYYKVFRKWRQIFCIMVQIWLSYITGIIMVLLDN